MGMIGQKALYGLIGKWYHKYMERQLTQLEIEALRKRIALNTFDTLMNRLMGVKES